MNNLGTNRLLWTALVPSVAFVGVALSAASLMTAPVHWEHWRPATCMPDGCFCEAIRRGTVRQVANTWSSFAFVFVSFWILGNVLFDRARASLSVPSGTTRSHHEQAINGNANAARAINPGVNAMRQRRVYPLMFAMSLLVVGFGSAFYHASLTFAGQFADVFGMYLIGTFVLVHNLGRLRPMSDVAASLSYVGLNVALAIMLYSIPEARRYAFAIVILAALLVEYLLRRRKFLQSDSRYLVGAVLVFAVAFVVWTLDIRRVICDAESLWQGHALWHLLGAAACAGVYLFYRSDRVR